MTRFIGIFTVLLLSLTSAGVPTAIELSQTAKVFLDQKGGSPLGFSSLGFLKSAQPVKFYYIDKYQDYNLPTKISAKILGAFTATNRNAPLVFGVLFDENGKAEKMVTLFEAAEEKCVPYYISEDSSFNVYYIADDRSTAEVLLKTREQVVAAVTAALQSNQLLSGFEQLVSRLVPNDNRYERQDKLRINNARPLHQNLIMEAIKSVKVPGVTNLFAGIERIGNPVQDPFNPQISAKCIVIN